MQNDKLSSWHPHNSSKPSSCGIELFLCQAARGHLSEMQTFARKYGNSPSLDIIDESSFSIAPQGLRLSCDNVPSVLGANLLLFSERPRNLGSEIMRMSASLANKRS